MTTLIEEQALFMDWGRAWVAIRSPMIPAQLLSSDATVSSQDVIDQSYWPIMRSTDNMFNQFQFYED